MLTVADNQKEEYYARIVPVLGEGLRARRIAVCGVAGVAGAVERLAGCRALRWALVDDTPLTPAHPLVRGWGAPSGIPAGAALAARLQAHNTWEDDWSFRIYPALSFATASALAAAWLADPPDLLLGSGDATALREISAIARALDLPAVLVLHCANADPFAACLALLPGDGGRGRDLSDLLAALGHPPLYDPAHLPPTPTAWYAWTDANALAAQVARALLLHGTPHGDPTLDTLLWHERRTAVILGTPAWPWSIHYVNLATAGHRPAISYQPPTVSFQNVAANGQQTARSTDHAVLPLSAAKEQNTQHATRNTPYSASSTQHSSLSTQHSALSTQHSALVVGCGSLGSLAARALVASGTVRRLVLVDGEMVDAANPVRQWFHTDQVGDPKAVALAHNLAVLNPAPEIMAIVSTLDDSRGGRADFRRLLRATRPAVVLLATGGEVDYALASILRKLNIPHVVGRCYPRARYFEAILVDGRHGPCFGCLRGHLYTGATPGPTPEEILRYDRPPTADTLPAEPATVVESGRAADVLARLATELARPRRARAPWLTALLASGQTCLLGANTVEWAASDSAPPAWAYGIPLPGQVVAYGLAQVLGTAATEVCIDCGRRLVVAHRA